MPLTSKILAKLKGSSKERRLQGAVSDSDYVVPNKIHSFWQGDIKKLMDHLANVSKTARLNPNYKIVLHVYPSDSVRIEDVVERLGSDANIRVKDITSEKWYERFKSSLRYSQFLASRTGGRAHLASGADIIKTELIYHKGGVWNDVDNVALVSLPESLKVRQSQILTAGPVTFARWGGMKGVHSSTFASYKNNSLLEEMNKESYKKYSSLARSIYKKVPETDNPDDHFKMVSQTAGSYHFSKELLARNPDFKKSLDALGRTGKKYDEDMIIFDKYFTPTASTGSGNWDEDQVVALLESMSKPGHVMI
ncbi:hypothetical protein [Pseudomonas sp. GW456-L14]|nr:hypothetical protein [Pseudomonas sp. GW456-L14]